MTATLDDAEMAAALDQIRIHLQTQDRLITQIQDGTCTECEPILRQTRDMLRIHLGQVENDIADPGTFRNQYQYQNQSAPRRHHRQLTAQSSNHNNPAHPLWTAQVNRAETTTHLLAHPCRRITKPIKTTKPIDQYDTNTNRTGDGNGTTPDPGGLGRSPNESNRERLVAAPCPHY